MTFVDKLRESAKERNSIVCMGLDPVIEFLPEVYQVDILGFVGFFKDILREMKDQQVFPGAFKPNQGFYTVHDKPKKHAYNGSIALTNIIDLIHDEMPGIPVILDSKRGDIGKSSANYAKENFENWGADATTVPPYMGTDSIAPFAEYTKNGKGVYVLNRTSNPGAADFQSRIVLPKEEDYITNPTLLSDLADEGRFLSLYEEVSIKIAKWAENYQGIGAVVGATAPEELGRIAKYFAGKDIPMLIPGVGSQGGSAEEVSKRLVDAGYDRSLARVNLSSGLTHLWAPKVAPADYAKVVVEKLNTLNEQINFKP